MDKALLQDWVCARPIRASIWPITPPIKILAIREYLAEFIVVFGYTKRWSDKIPTVAGRRGRSRLATHEYWLIDFEVEDPKNEDLWVLVGLGLNESANTPWSIHNLLITNGEEFIPVCGGLKGLNFLAPADRADGAPSILTPDLKRAISKAIEVVALQDKLR